jgi:hypothetical protein
MMAQPTVGGSGRFSGLPFGTYTLEIASLLGAQKNGLTCISSLLSGPISPRFIELAVQAPFQTGTLTIVTDRDLDQTGFPLLC